jgi:tetratricopeptide (TPR) repeat protein
MAVVESGDPTNGATRTARGSTSCACVPTESRREQRLTLLRWHPRQAHERRGGPRAAPLAFGPVPLLPFRPIMEDTRISHYRIGRLLGRGGMGEVYEAIDLDLDRAVALKFVAPELASDAETLKRFEREARAAAALTHPHIAVLYAFDRTTERPFIAMELMSGESLRDRLGGGPLPVADALALARDVASGLALAHRRGIAHRDIKPGNLMFDRDGAIKITDFGLARATQASRLTMTGSTLGTAAYMAPESVRASQAAMGDAATGAAAPGAPADVFALGVTLHEMIAGGLPFTGDSPLALLYVIANEPPRRLREVSPECPEAVEALVTRMLDKDPAARPDAATVTRELAMLTGTPIPASVIESAGGGSAATRTAPVTLAPGARTVELDAERLSAQPPAPVGGLAVEAPPTHGRTRGGPMRWMWAPIALLGMLTGLWWGPGRSFFAGRATERAKLLNNQGFDALQSGDAVTARARFLEALRVSPRYGQAAINLARALGYAGRDSAVMVLERVVREHPGDPRLTSTAYSALGDFDMEDRAWVEAAHHYALAALTDPADVAHRNNQAFALIQGGRPDTAQTVLAEAIRRDPARAPLYKNMALAWLRRGQPDSALVWLDEAGRRDSTLASVWQVRAEAAARRHDTAAARRSLSRFIALGGDSATAASLAVELGLTSTR